MTEIPSDRTRLVEAMTALNRAKNAITSPAEDALIDVCEHILALLSQGEATAPWQPIETAPSDTTVLVHDMGYVGKGILLENGRWLDVECGRDDAWFDPPPTEWMPLPPAPTAEPSR